ncbi:hypothetical protein [Spirosoma fluviale]|uniref:Uncharacterized protein n=1 Tax=Spirosoma fluviale TaxID=1597977 RepID=A0A286FCS0_9BACT|nr:hypothetical protein [Spirosoma fluviale]SOD80993.1 hypothetical protein SAMN06269250_1638 [Spirosoma fluviale]
MIPGFDEAQLNEDAGLSQSSIKLDVTSDGSFAMNPDDKSAMEKIAAQTPTGISTPAPPALPAVPEYLSTHMPAPDAAPASRESIDWGQRWQETFGAAPEAETEINRDSFEAAVVKRDSYEEFLAAKPEVPVLREIVSGSLSEVELVQQAVKGELQRNGIRSTAVYDQEMQLYLDENGQLTQAGKERASQEKQQATRQLTQIETAASQHADDAVSGLSNFYQVLDTTATNFKPFGIELPETTVADMKEDIRSGRVDAWLDSSKTSQEAAHKMFLLSLISDQTRLAEFIRLADLRGQEYGANRRLASQLS